MKHHRGFTLLELLVAIGIFALISGIAYGSLTRLMVDRERLQAEQAFWSRLSLTFARLEEDLSQARERNVRDVIGFTQPAFRGQPTDTRALAPPSVEFTRGGVLTFSDGARSDLQRVAYRLDDGTLKRLTWPVLDLGPQTVPVETPLLDNVEEFRVQFYAPATPTPDVWLDVWPTQGINDPLPRGVKVEMTLKGRGEFTRLFLVNG
jgi:general secretion pathway protein J